MNKIYSFEVVRITEEEGLAEVAARNEDEAYDKAVRLAKKMDLELAGPPEIEVYLLKTAEGEDGED